MLTIIILPVDRRSGAYEAFLADGRLLCRSRAPMLTSARKLLRRGHDPATILEMVHGSTPDIVALSAPIGVAARYSVAEGTLQPRFVRWKAFSPQTVRPLMRPRKRPVPDPARRPKRTSAPKTHQHEVTAS